MDKKQPSRSGPARIKRDLVSGLAGIMGGDRTRGSVQQQAMDLLALSRNYEEMHLGWFWATDARGRLTYLGSSACAALAVELNDVLGKDLTTIFPAKPADPDKHRNLAFILAKQSRFQGIRFALKTNDGERFWAISGNPQIDSEGQFLGYLGHGVDVTDARRSAEESSRLAMYDPLTGLSNRRRMQQLVDSALRDHNARQTPCAVLLIDLDRFKQINDTLGHPAGDELLKQVAQRLTAIVGDAERVGRIGGDEFQIVLDKTDDPEVLGPLAQSIIDALSQPYSVNGSRCVIGASIGITASPFEEATTDEAVRNADLALYAAKGAGRGRYRFFSAGMLEEAADRRALEHDLMDALGRGEMQVHYQPIVNAESGEATGFEALLRWNHPQRGRISPSIFIPIAEETNLIPLLGDWALRQACRDAATWPSSIRVAVNVSPIQFANANLPQVVINALAQSGLAPSRLELEITESVFLGDSKETDRMFAALKGLGVRLALDDFGTGYSSLGYLKTAPFDKIKIDQSFVRDAIEPGSRNSAIIAAIVALADALGMETTAEGVESFDQLELVRNLKVSHIQGYLYSLPIPAEDVAARVSDGSWRIKPDGPARQRSSRRATFRRIGAIHGNHYYPVMLRNLSRTGALIEGLVDVPIGTQFLIDFGEGQWAIATVSRTYRHQQGVEFAQALVDNGEGGLCTRTRVSASMMARAGILPGELRPNAHVLMTSDDGQLSLPEFQMVNGSTPIEMGRSARG